MYSYIYIFLFTSAMCILAAPTSSSPQKEPSLWWQVDLLQTHIIYALIMYSHQGDNRYVLYIYI